MKTSRIFLFLGTFFLKKKEIDSKRLLSENEDLKFKLRKFHDLEVENFRLNELNKKLIKQIWNMKSIIDDLDKENEELMQILEKK